MQIMSHRCCNFQNPFTHAGSKRHHEKYTCWKRLENGHFPSSPAVTRVDAPKITYLTESNPGIPSGIEKGKAFRLQEAKLQTNRTRGLTRSRIETFLSAQEEHNFQGNTTREEVPEITFPTQNNPGIPSGIERGIAFRFKTPSSILIVGLSGCAKTCFAESLLLDHLEELFVNPPPTIHYCYGAWQDGFHTMKEAGVQFHEGVATTSHLQKWKVS